MMSSSMSTERDAPRRGARLVAYGLWQMRDYLVDRGAPTFIVLTLFGYLGLPRADAALVPRSLILQHGGREAARLAMLHDFSAIFLANFLGVVCFLGALFAMNGIVANDRKQGFFRFLFAKPIAPSAYYGQAFLLHWIGFLAVATILALIYGAFVVPVLSVPLFTVLALMFLCYAGIAFTLSAAARWDWLSLVLVTLVATYLWDRFGASRHPLAKLVYLFPPLNRTAEVYGAAAQGVAPPWHTLAWLAGYGAVCFVIGLLVLRFRRLAII
jgi:hypothetical protein